MDVFTGKKRSQIMSNIRSKNTKIEVKARKWLWQKGYRYRKNVTHLPGKPDIVFYNIKTVVFVHGCFWHGHDKCAIFRLPKSRLAFWKNKITNNKIRDIRNQRILRKLGWKIINLWECKFEKDFVKEMNRVLRLLKVKKET